MTIEITDEMRSVGMEQMICPEDSCFACERIVDRILTAALPIIEKQVREQCAAEIEVHMRRHDHSQVGFSAVGDAYAHAARIVREGE